MKILGMKSRPGLYAVTVIAAMTLAACGNGAEETATEEPDDTVEGDDVEDDREDISIRLADINAPTHFVSANLVAPFIEAVEDLSDGHIEIDYFPEGQLGSPDDLVDLLQSGVSDASLLAPAYNSTEMPLGNAVQLPRVAEDAATLTHAYYEWMMTEDSTVREVDFDQNGIVPLAAGANPLYQLVTVDQPIDSVDALQGLGIRSGGGSLDLVVEALGGSPVAVAAPEQYQALERGILDGAIFNLPSMISNATMEVTNHATLNANVSSFALAIGVSDSVWDDLPEWAQDVLIEAGEIATDNWATYVIESEDEVLETLRDEGIEFYEFDDDQLAELEERLAPVAEQWIADMEDQGLPGQQAWDEILELVG
jgi:TRAP-type transport system periplasmic protein